MTRQSRNRRRGLSSVVGAVFMVLVMIGALNVILLAMRQQDSVTQTLIDKSNTSLGRLNEQISITDIKVTNVNKLNMTVANSGGSTAKLATIYIVNETASPKTQYRYDLGNVPVDGRASKTNIGTSLALNVMSGTKYSVKIVTAAGTTATTGITPISQAALPMSLYVIPPTVSPGNNVTLLFTVSNNITDSNLGWAVTPAMQTPTCSGCTLTLMESPSSTVIPKGNTALFKWKYKVTSPDTAEHNMSFNASLTNAKRGNYVIETGVAKLVEASQISYTDVVISNDILQKPEIFLMVPSPFGDSGDKGLWGVVVVNPTNQPMNINRIVISMYSSQAAANQQFIEKISCNISWSTPNPPPATNWSCPLDNMIEWKNTASPTVIPGYGVTSFLVRIQPGKLTSGPASAFMISTAVFSSLGQFTKTGTSSSMNDVATSLASAYLTDTTVASTALLNSPTNHMLGHQSSVIQNQTYTFSIAVADLDTAIGTTIKNGTKVIITVPVGFTAVTPSSLLSTGFYFNAQEPQKLNYIDGSTQIIATMNGALGDTAITGAEAKILTFTAKTPVLTSGTKVYIMHILADGQTESNWSVGPLAQIAIQVYKP